MGAAIAVGYSSFVHVRACEYSREFPGLVTSDTITDGLCIIARCFRDYAVNEEIARPNRRTFVVSRARCGTIHGAWQLGRFNGPVKSCSRRVTVNRTAASRRERPTLRNITFAIGCTRGKRKSMKLTYSPRKSLYIHVADLTRDDTRCVSSFRLSRIHCFPQRFHDAEENFYRIAKKDRIGRATWTRILIR